MGLHKLLHYNRSSRFHPKNRLHRHGRYEGTHKTGNNNIQAQQAAARARGYVSLSIPLFPEKR